MKFQKIEFDEEILKKCNEILSESKNPEDVIKYLRDEGFSKVMSMNILEKVTNIESDECKKLVHFSKTWADVKERDDKFHDDLMKAMEKL